VVHLCLISTAITLMVPKKQYGRANGMMSLVESRPGVFAPLLAGALLPLIRLTGIMLIDVVTFVLAIGALLVVHIPQPPVTEEGRQGQGNLLREAAYGFQYIFKRPSLLGLQLVFLDGNLMAGLGFVVMAPMILSSNQAIWQAKVAPDVQGRVFTARGLIAWITQPISPLIAGPLADLVLEPAMRQGGGLTGTFGRLVGTGPGAGMALWLMLTGILGALVGLGSYAFPVVRNAEDILPDHQAAPAAE